MCFIDACFFKWLYEFVNELVKNTLQKHAETIKLLVAKHTTGESIDLFFCKHFLHLILSFEQIVVVILERIQYQSSSLTSVECRTSGLRTEGAICL